MKPLLINKKKLMEIAKLNEYLEFNFDKIHSM